MDATASVGYLPSDAFNKGIVFGLGFTTFFNDVIGWEVFNAQYVMNIETSLKQELVENFADEIAQVGFEDRLDPIQYYVTSNLIFTPMYTKNLIFNNTTILNDLTFVLGGGVVGFTSTGIKPMLDTGFYFRFYLSEAASVKADLRANFFKDEGLGIGSFMSMILSFSYQIGEAPGYFYE